eukprot:scaffold65_cov353-Prasinococcus_capsulatus_cf.AAC.9
MTAGVAAALSPAKATPARHSPPTADKSPMLSSAAKQAGQWCVLSPLLKALRRKRLMNPVESTCAL